VQVAQDDQEIIARVAALDIGKAEDVCCVRVPGQGPRARRMQEVRTYTTMTRSLLAMSDWLTGLGVTRVVMEATSDYWKPPFYLVENSFETWLVNAKDVKHLPGRPKTDLLTELPDRIVGLVPRLALEVATFRADGQRRGWAAGVVAVGGAATRVA